ncbi:MAG: hypothetical protein WBB64_08770, partial [Anaerolineales bacterium]
GKAILKNDGVTVNEEESVSMSIRIAGMNRRQWEVRRIEGNKEMPVTVGAPALTFRVAPGDYVIRKK